MKKNKKIISRQMILFEFRKTIGNPYVHIFGIGMPILMALLITKAVGAQIPEGEILSATVTSIFLGIGSLIPLATILMGYAVSHSQELEKGIPQRMELFGISLGESICNRILSELIFMTLAFIIYFVVGYLFIEISTPTAAGLVLYLLSILCLSLILFCLAHAVSSLLRKFALTYCVTMLLYFGMMMASGMMGISYDNMPSAVQAVAKMLPTTYINRDFVTVWSGEAYNFAPMCQAYLLMAAVSGVLLFFSLKKGARKLH